ncbi:NUDIX domain-containing protein [Candidatus Woesebacteria bacterium]|nr:NUDIX domain-containing protein [Candidatus Woesebacteria bacterium]
MSTPEFEHKPSLKQAVIFLIHEDGKILLEKRLNPGKSYSGRIIIPGGKVEIDQNETPEQAVIREIREECKVEPTKLTLLDTFEDVTPGLNHYLFTAYLVTDYQGKIENNEPEKSGHMWVELSSAKNFVNFASSRYVLLLAEKYLTRKD